MRITCKAYAKINWALDVVGQREDGYHELDMLMQRISLCDELSFESDSALSLSVGGREVPGGGRNLVLKAADALMAFSGKKRGARIELTKHIPARAGLGGGSSDCAAALIALNKLWRLNLPMRHLIQIAEGLGADVPFCLTGALARVTGIGEKIEPLMAGSSYPLVILTGKGLGTAEVFAVWDAAGHRGLGLNMDACQQALARGELDSFIERAGNALEQAAISLSPEIWAARQALYDHGARFAQMSGSGSAVFGVFESMLDARSAARALGREAIVAETLP